jgi:hypothetical protein
MQQKFKDKQKWNLLTKHLEAVYAYIVSQYMVQPLGVWTSHW